MSDIRVGDLVEVQLSTTMEEEVWVGLRFVVQGLPNHVRGLYRGPITRLSPHPDFRRLTGLKEGVVVHFRRQDIRRVTGRFGEWYRSHS